MDAATKQKAETLAKQLRDLFNKELNPWLEIDFTNVFNALVALLENCENDAQADSALQVLIRIKQDFLARKDQVNRATTEKKLIELLEILRVG